MDLVKLCLAPCCSCWQSPVVREDMSSVFFTKEKLDRLEEVMKDLRAKKQDIERELNLHQNKGKRPTNQLRLWLDKVAEKDKKVAQLLDEYSKGCCVRGPCCINCFSRYRISRDAINLLDEITEMKGEQSEEVSFIEQEPPKPVPESYKTVGEKIGSNFDIARNYLADETVGMMGIWGMGGVGKTALLKKIDQSLLEDTNMGFNHVLFVEASQNIQLEKLREKIAKKLLPSASSATKEDIFNVLKINNFVLLLDDIWKEIDLTDLGIPHPFSDNNSTKKYKHKVIFTTRSEDVCARMGASKRIKVECLEQDEAWELFKDNVNLDVIESDEKFKEIAWQVMKMCGNLPLALKVIGKAMSNKKTIEEWDFILKSMQDSNIEVVEGVEESLFPILKFSYDNLPHNMNIKECFLCASMLRWATKDELFECWMGLGLIGDFDNLQQAYGKAKYILSILEEACLLSVYKRNNHGLDDRVVLHDVIYKMAMWIASDCGKNKNKWMVMNRYGIPTNEGENWRFANFVILDRYLFRVLPVLPHQCSELLCLMIKNNICLKNIPKGFFRQMPNLVYLDLSNTGIRELPKDIQCLAKLQYLNISNTEISSLPNELGKLNNLQYLICRNLYRLGKIQKNMLIMSKLLKLKVLDIYPYGWIEPKKLKILKKYIKAIGMCVVSQEALQQLSCLPIIRISIKLLDDMASLSFDTLSCKNHGLLQELEIGSCTNLEELVMNGTKRSHLKNLIIYDVQKLQQITFSEIPSQEYFHKLKNIHINGCKLASFAWVLHLPCLVHLSIGDCAEIEELFNVDDQKREIQQVSEENPEIEELFNVDDQKREIQQVSEGNPEVSHANKAAVKSSKNIIFPSLQSLHLTYLPNLVSISNSALDFPQLSRLLLHKCLNLKKLPFKLAINNSKRIDIYCEEKWWESLGHDGTVPPHLSPKFSAAERRELRGLRF